MHADIFILYIYFKNIFSIKKLEPVKTLNGK